MGRAPSRSSRARRHSARRGRAARLEEDADPRPFLPAKDRVLRDVGEEQVAAIADPDRPLGPVEPVGQAFHPRSRRDDAVEAVVVPLDRPDRREGLPVTGVHATRDQDQGEQEEKMGERREGAATLPDRIHRRLHPSGPKRTELGPGTTRPRGPHPHARGLELSPPRQDWQPPSGEKQERSQDEQR